MKTSPFGIAALEHEEGVVLRAYRDVAGVWTIGAGLTAASGVVVPRAGMEITAQEARRLLEQALTRNYEPAVETAMSIVAGAKVTRPTQNQFDAGVSFHFNTGAIGRASWVKAWKAGKPAGAIRAAMLLWSKAGGRELRGLVLRRQREADMLLDGVYFNPLARANQPPAQPTYLALAAWTANIDPETRKAATQSLIAMGYDHRDGAITAIGVRKFQQDHALTADGIIGRATLATIQRRVDAACRAVIAAPATASAAAVTIMPGSVAPAAQMPWLAPLVGAALLAWMLWQAWAYRDALAAKIQNQMPRVAAFLRRF
jgi:lysozyme